MSEDTLMDRLRVATREAHVALQELPYFEALRRDELPRESLVGHLRALAVIHAVVERTLGTSADARIAAVWSEAMARFPAIQTDLEYFSASLVLDIPTANDEAEALAANVLRRSMRSPMSLLGYLYVLEGSVSGARELAPVFRQALGG